MDKEELIRRHNEVMGEIAKLQNVANELGEDKLIKLIKSGV